MNRLLRRRGEREPPRLLAAAERGPCDLEREDPGFVAAGGGRRSDEAQRVTAGDGQRGAGPDGGGGEHESLGGRRARQPARHERAIDPRVDHESQLCQASRRPRVGDLRQFFGREVERLGASGPADRHVELDRRRFQIGVSRRLAAGQLGWQADSARLGQRNGRRVFRLLVAVHRLVGLRPHVPHAARDLVAVEDRVPTHGYRVVDAAAEGIEVAAEHQDAVVPHASVEAVGRGGEDRLLRVCTNPRESVLRRHEPVGEHLEGVVALATEEEVRRLSIEAAREHVVAGTAEDPVLARAALQDVVTSAADDDVVTRGREQAERIAKRRCRLPAEVETYAVDDRGGELRGDHVLRRIAARNLEPVSARVEAGERQAHRSASGGDGARHDRLLEIAGPLFEQFDRDRAGRVERLDAEAVALSGRWQREAVVDAAPLDDRLADDRGHSQDRHGGLAARSLQRVENRVVERDVDLRADHSLGELERQFVDGGDPVALDVDEVFFAGVELGEIEVQSSGGVDGRLRGRERSHRLAGRISDSHRDPVEG